MMASPAASSPMRVTSSTFEPAAAAAVATVAAKPAGAASPDASTRPAISPATTITFTGYRVRPQPSCPERLPELSSLRDPDPLEPPPDSSLPELPDVPELPESSLPELPDVPELPESSDPLEPLPE